MEAANVFYCVYVTRDYSTREAANVFYYSTREAANVFYCVYVTRDYSTIEAANVFYYSTREAANVFYCVHVTRDYSTMEAADLSLGGTVLLSDCQNMDKIPDVSFSCFPNSAQLLSLNFFYFPLVRC